ncbi:rhodanese-like domain-containing protein [Xanthomarina sp. F1114]|uniref:rhodanese-like domain-containing protein n=1 Tax=Xanthomarina sp. F1114 TaxID=2996019 RepID=UPI00225DDAB8|nr:rhodanese-like domain-containing protein [Xanthomarina sp. F1114]MCX7548200.1 rhodanese-like domain-containing protein [Xanthomarina sp. F1114]
MKHVLIFSLFLITFFSCKETRSEQIKVVTAEEMQDILDLEEVQLIDVRTPEEFNDGHITNAQNINFYSDTFEEDILKLDKSKPVILYCKSGRRSAACSEKLVEAGFVKVYDLKGGITQWKHQGLETNN